MKLTEKQAFEIMKKIMQWAYPTGTITEEERYDFIMNELINFELPDE